MQTSVQQDSKKKVVGEPLGSTRQAVLVVAAVFAASVLLLCLVYAKFPKLEPQWNKVALNDEPYLNRDNSQTIRATALEELQYIKLPKDINDAKHLGRVLSRYKDRFFYQVVAGVFLIYIFLQTFAIPGSIFLSILSGYLFPFYMALLLVCFCSAVGASFCYMLFYLVGKRIVNKYFPERVKSWAETVNNHRDNLLSYIIFLRITPFLPNWFINITSPIINVPLFPFFIGTFLGVAPPSFVAIQAGTTLYKLTSSSDAVSWNSILLLAVFAVLSLIPVLFRQKLKSTYN